MLNQPQLKSADGKGLAVNLLSIVLIVYIAHALRTVIVPILFSILIAILLYPIALFFERKLRLGKVVASILSVIIATVIIGLLIWFIVYQVLVIGTDGGEYKTKFAEIYAIIQRWLSETLGLSRWELNQKVNAEISKLSNNATSYATKFVGSMGSVIANVVLIPIYVFFMLYYRVFFREFFFKVFKNVPNEKVHHVLDKIYYVVQNYLLGLVTVMGIVAALNTIGLYIMGIQYAWFFGILASLLMLLPYIGIAIGSILPAIFALATKDSYWYAVGVVLWFQFVQFLEGNFITPNIVGGKVSINPLMAIVAIILGGMMFGLSGLILALPITAVLKVVFDSNENLAPYGFLIGEPNKDYLKRSSIKSFIKKWNLRSSKEDLKKEKQENKNDTDWDEELKNE